MRAASITAEQLDTALEHQRASGKLMGEILVDLGILDPVDLCRILAERRGYQFVDLRERPVDLSLMDLVPEEVARRYSALPIAHQDDHVVVAMAQPENVFALDDLRVLTELPVFPVMAEPQQISAAISRCYGTVEPETAAEPATDAGAASPRTGQARTAPLPRRPRPRCPKRPSRARHRPATRRQPHLSPSRPRPRCPRRTKRSSASPACSSSRRSANARRTSTSKRSPNQLRVRFRVDGLLREVSDAPLSALRPLINRVKVLAGMDVGRSRVPREGRFAVSVEEREIDVRVAILPTAHDDSCVLRLLDRERSIADVEMLGFANDQRARYTDAIRKPRGLVVVSGPAGSGRTSTLYATMRSMNTPERSLSSVEDPIAYSVDGVKQLEVDELAGLSFPAALRLVLHSDPEAVLVDEIEESESLALATDAAIAGRLVLAALHAPSAVAVPLRLVDMGVEPYLVAASLSCVVSQRLVRTLCPYCSQEDARSRPLLQKLGVQEDALEASTLRRPVGCDECRDSGYLGRTAVFEVMPITESMQRLVQDRAPAPELKRLAVAEGMETMRKRRAQPSARG